MCSHYVPMGFSKVSLSYQVIPQDVPNSTWISSPIICPTFNSHVYKLKRLAIGENICLYFVTWGPKRCFYWRVPNVPEKNWWWPNQYGTFQKEKMCGHTHELINMNHTMSHLFFLLVA
jgi:hypothetical protein